MDNCIYLYITYSWTPTETLTELVSNWTQHHGHQLNESELVFHQIYQVTWSNIHGTASPRYPRYAMLKKHQVSQLLFKHSSFWFSSPLERGPTSTSNFSRMETEILEILLTPSVASKIRWVLTPKKTTSQYKCVGFCDFCWLLSADHVYDHFVELGYLNFGNSWDAIGKYPAESSHWQRKTFRGPGLLKEKAPGCFSPLWLQSALFRVSASR